MKKLLLAIPILAIVFLFATPALATSGACSYHGGVNCAAGPAANGDAICNDGFDSSTSYYTTQECLVNVCSTQFANSTYTAYVTANVSWRSGLTANITSLISSLQNTIVNDQASDQADQASNNAALASLKASYDEAVQQIQQNEDAAQGAAGAASGGWGKNAANGVATQYQGYIDEATAAYDAAVAQDNAILAEEEASNNTSGVQACVNLWNGVQTKMSAANSYCANTYGPASSAISSNLLSCTCGSGYVLQSGECVSNIDACQNIYGQSAFANSDGSCSCSAGFKLDAANHSCDYVGQSAAPSTPTPISVTSAPQPIKNTAAISIRAEQTIEPVSNTVFQVPTTTASSAQPMTDNKVQPPASIWHTISGWLSKLNPFSWFSR